MNEEKNVLEMFIVELDNIGRGKNIFEQKLIKHLLFCSRSSGLNVVRTMIIERHHRGLFNRFSSLWARQ